MIKTSFTRMGRFIVLSCLGSVLSCASPTEGVIVEAVSRSLEKRVPVTLASYLTGGQNALVEEVRVLEISKAIGKGKNTYWRAQIYARGVCRVMFGGHKSFEGKAVYRIYKDAFDNWRAAPDEF